MIRVTRLNGVAFVVNAELIEQIESAPDTVLTLTTGNNIIVRESIDEVERRVIAYKASIEVERTARRSTADAGK